MSNDPRSGKSIIRGGRRPTAKQTIDHTLDDAFTLFYNVKKAEGMRDRTLADYKAHWRYFREWIDKEEPGIKLREITQSTLRAYVIYMSSGRTKYDGVDNRKIEGATLSPTTVAIRLRTLRTMFNFWAGENMIDVNPAQKLKAPRQDEEDIEAFTDEQVRLLLAAPDVRSYAGFRDKVLMMLLADTGLRINEALQLTTEHFDVRSRCITLPAAMNKNRKPRIVPVSNEVVRQVFDLVNENKSYFNTEYIFVANYGEPLKADHFRKRLHEYGVRTGIVGQVRVSPHTFRHYFCTAYLENGGDVFTLQRIAGHADLETTRKYVKTRTEAMQEQHAAVSPITRLGRRIIARS
ncbi:tyrosine-type recombinase/integrase [Paenibacillus naphthalenovorans]|uniref:tyrosine-type recombinase/integrase n=1 Tax=Paenibacillus naphthalenovorans TaxID=162209 RepID=UPI003D27C559